MLWRFGQDFGFGLFEGGWFGKQPVQNHEGGGFAGDGGFAAFDIPGGVLPERFADAAGAAPSGSYGCSTWLVKVPVHANP